MEREQIKKQTKQKQKKKTTNKTITTVTMAISNGLGIWQLGQLGK
jgi:hypothetical protein